MLVAVSYARAPEAERHIYYAVVKETRTCHSKRSGRSVIRLNLPVWKQTDMKKCHCTNVLENSCLKTPGDPRTKVPLAQY